jgi:hypothetical protein
MAIIVKTLLALFCRRRPPAAPVRAARQTYPTIDRPRETE